jgi:hypothetical protein
VTTGAATSPLVEELSLIKDSLLASYARLEERAERV